MIKKGFISELPYSQTNGSLKKENERQNAQGSRGGKSSMIFNLLQLIIKDRDGTLFSSGLN